MNATTKAPRHKEYVMFFLTYNFLTNNKKDLGALVIIKEQKMFKSLSDKEEKVAKQIVDAAFQVHKQLGPGFLEKVYEACFCYELSKRGIAFRQQVEVPIVYDQKSFDVGFRLDVLVEDLIICELKAVEEMNPVFEAQIMSYLKMAKKRLGFLINFNVPIIKNGIRRIIL